MTLFFQGNKLAIEKEGELKKGVKLLKKRGIVPKLVSIVIGDKGGVNFYQNLKKKKGERIGAVVAIESYAENVGYDEVVDKIKELNQDESVHGVMIQLPLPENLRVKTKKLIQEIKPEKDVDGMRQDSPFLAPVVNAVLISFKQASESIVRQSLRITVVGARGFVGSKIVKALKEVGYRAESVDLENKDLKLKTQKADVVVSATGKPGLINSSYVKDGFIAIDVGAPRGDFDSSAINKASFATPVPGGIGPVTILCLLENLLKAAGSIAK